MTKTVEYPAKVSPIRNPYHGQVDYIVVDSRSDQTGFDCRICNCSDKKNAQLIAGLINNENTRKK